MEQGAVAMTQRVQRVASLKLIVGFIGTFGDCVKWMVCGFNFYSHVMPRYLAKGIQKLGVESRRDSQFYSHVMPRYLAKGKDKIIS